MEYPEHEKLRAIKDQSEPIGQFLADMECEGIELCKFDREVGEYQPLYKSINAILADYFEIDLVKLEEEKQAMLKEVRAARTS